METQNEILKELGFGLIPNIFAWTEKAPEAQTALWKAFRHGVLRGRLPRTLKEMMGVLVSRANQSPYAAQVHLHALMVQGVEEPLLEALGRGEVPPGLSPKTQALLRFAQQAGANPKNTLAVAALRQAGLEEAEVLEAVATVALFRMVNAWTDLLEIPLDAL